MAVFQVFSISGIHFRGGSISQRLKLKRGAWLKQEVVQSDSVSLRLPQLKLSVVSCPTSLTRADMLLQPPWNVVRERPRDVSTRRLSKKKWPDWENGQKERKRRLCFPGKGPVSRETGSSFLNKSKYQHNLGEKNSLFCDFFFVCGKSVLFAFGSRWWAVESTSQFRSGGWDVNWSVKTHAGWHLVEENVNVSLSGFLLVKGHWLLTR